jgi:hypothetical protein
VKLATHLHRRSRQRMRGAIPLVRLHSFMAWEEKTLPVANVVRRARNRDEASEGSVTAGKFLNS